MTDFVADCPRCGAKQITFDVRSWNSVSTQFPATRESFSICRRCKKSTVFLLRDANKGSTELLLKGLGAVPSTETLNRFVDLVGHVSFADVASASVPDHVPPTIGAAFTEGARCLSVRCFNAAATMFRLCVDLSTKALLPAEDTTGLTAKSRRDLGLRLPWLLDNGKLPQELRGLASCIKEDGNDGAHAGTLTEADARDLLDFTEALLERLYTEPERLRLAEARRTERRKPPSDPK
jgi:hypothetical protein